MLFRSARARHALTEWRKRAQQRTLAFCVSIRHAEYMVPSTYHWQPLINGYSDHIPQDFRDQAPVLATFPSREAFNILQPLGARYVVFHLDLMAAADREALVTRLDTDYTGYLRPLNKDGNVWLYEIVSWPR